MVHRIGIEERRRRLARRHHLAAAARAPDVETSVAGMVGLHATDPATPFLAARSRVDGFEAGLLEQALFADRTLIKHLCMRRTLFVISTADLPGIQSAVSDAVAATERRRLIADLEKGGVTRAGERWLRGVEKAVREALADGPKRGAELSRAVPRMRTTLTYAPDRPWGGEVGIATRVLTVMAVEGHLRRGPPAGAWTSSQHRWELVDEAIERLPVLEGRRRLLQAWLRVVAPATTDDLRWWTGLGTRDLAAALEASGAVDVDVDGAPAWVLPDDLAPTDDVDPWVALLPALDPTVMAWKERAWFLDDHRPRLFDRNGNAGPTIWVDGRVVGGWGQRPSGEVAVDVFDDVGLEARAAIDDEASRLEAWLDGSVVTPRFATPTERRLRA